MVAFPRYCARKSWEPQCSRFHEKQRQRYSAASSGTETFQIQPIAGALGEHAYHRAQGKFALRVAQGQGLIHVLFECWLAVPSA
jgi:hypothetical protein